MSILCSYDFPPGEVLFTEVHVFFKYSPYQSSFVCGVNIFMSADFRDKISRTGNVLGSDGFVIWKLCEDRKMFFFVLIFFT